MDQHAQDRRVRGRDGLPVSQLTVTVYGDRDWLALSVVPPPPQPPVLPPAAALRAAFKLLQNGETLGPSRVPVTAITPDLAGKLNGREDLIQ